MKTKEPLFKVNATGPEILAKAKEFQAEVEAGKRKVTAANPVVKINLTGREALDLGRKVVVEDEAAKKNAPPKRAKETQ